MLRYKFYKTLNLLPTPNKPWEEIIMGFIIGLLSSRWKDGIYNSISIIVDYYIKIARYILIIAKLNAVGLVDIIY